MQFPFASGFKGKQPVSGTRRIQRETQTAHSWCQGEANCLSRCRGEATRLSQHQAQVAHSRRQAQATHSRYQGPANSLSRCQAQATGLSWCQPQATHSHCQGEATHSRYREQATRETSGQKALHIRLFNRPSAYNYTLSQPSGESQVTNCT